MQEWLSLLYVGPQQALPVIVAVVLWVALAGLGALVTPRGRMVEAAPFVGWAVVSTVFTLVGVVVAQPFFVLSILAGLGAFGGIALALARREPLFVPGSWRVLVLALPLLLIAGAMEPSQWDEFSHWLPAPKYLTLFDGFPTAARPDAGPQMLPAYPYAWPILIHLAARLNGGLLDNVGGILNIVMLLSVATCAVRIAFAAAGRPRGPSIGWPLAAGIVLTATLFNPTFVQKIVLTSYSDVACSAVTGMTLVVGYRLLASLARDDEAPVPTRAWEFALILALLVNIRQPNVVVAAAILGALALVTLRDPDLSVGRFLAAAGPALLPALVVYVAWRWYVGREFADLVGAEAHLKPIDRWNIALIPQILLAMADVAFKKFAFFGPMLIACGFAVRALVRGVRTDFDRIAVLTATVFAAYNAFLLFTYVAHFDERGATTVVSFWRYNIDVGAVSIIFIASGVLVAWSRHRSFDSYPRWAMPAAVALIVLAPVALANKIRFDLEPPKPHFVRIAKDMATMGIAGSHFVLDPTGTGESAVITRVHLGTRGHAWMAAFQNPTPGNIASYVGAIRPGNYLVVHSVAPGAAEALGRPLDPRRSYLFKREADGWTLVKDWPKPADHPW